MTCQSAAGGSMSKRLLIVCNQPSPNTARLAEAVLDGARDSAIDGVSATLKCPLDATPEDVQNADGIIIGTTENFAYMSGLIKDFFERVYNPCLEKTQGRPYALYVRAGNDGAGTVTAVERIVTGLRWKAIQPTLVLQGDFQEHFVDDCRELGMLMAAGLEASVF